MRQATRKALLTTASAAALAATLTAPAHAATKAPPLAWQPCAEKDGRECATLQVPLDYDRPDGPAADIAVSRLRSDHPEARRGTLLLIPGGPGGSGRRRLAETGRRLREETRGAYDIVSLDPRGTGGSTRADCGIAEDDRQLVNLHPWPGPGGDISATAARARRIADACARNGGAFVRGLSTANEVRDIDRFRQALGEEKLSAWGVSYGTYVGAVYAQKYPQHTDRWVLDSNDDPDPSRVARGWLANMSAGVDDRFPDFAAWAADPARGADRLAEKAADVRPMFLALADRLDRAPRRFADTKHALTGNLLRQVMQLSLESDARFRGLAGLIRAARTGDGPLGVPDPMPGPLSQADAAVAVGVICNDVGDWPRSVAAYARSVASDRARHPLTAGMPAGITPCSFWKTAPTEKPTRVTSDGPSNVLLVQNLRDPASPYAGALKLRAAFGGRARMLTVDGGGHEVYLGGGNACGDAAVTSFLVRGDRAGDVFCPAG
ncbi:alpha/beta hydrolase [Streptomyces sp. NPDC020379]|uniref:alpha/beta hydrolase n=1 Tax=Streptomyces sp. NPDC020379 TaxID=3365071 RepID=UPI0037AAA1E4